MTLLIVSLLSVTSIVSSTRSLWQTWKARSRLDEHRLDSSRLEDWKEFVDLARIQVDALGKEYRKILAGSSSGEGASVDYPPDPTDHAIRMKRIEEAVGRPGHIHPDHDLVDETAIEMARLVGDRSVLDAIYDLQNQVLDDEQFERDRSHALWLLTRFPGDLYPLDHDVIRAGLRLARHGADSVAREQALRALKGLDEPFMARDLVWILREDESERVREEAVEALAGLVRLVEVRNQLMESSLHDQASSVRHQCKRLLAKERP